MPCLIALKLSLKSQCELNFGVKVNFRIIGVDREALETQVTERKQAESVDQARNNAYNNDMIRNDKLAVLLQERQDKDTRHLQQQLNNFRSQYQVHRRQDFAAAVRRIYLNFQNR